jgi:hypothetical protein
LRALIAANAGVRQGAGIRGLQIKSPEENEEA